LVLQPPATTSLSIDGPSGTSSSLDGVRLLGAKDPGARVSEHLALLNHGLMTACRDIDRCEDANAPIGAVAASKRSDPAALGTIQDSVSSSSRNHEDDTMARSVDELRREAERNRAALATTVDQLRDRISDTAEDIRHKVSPQHIRAEVSDYISHKTYGWLGALRQKANDNPMQALAAGTAIAVPVLRLARGFPLPLLLIGAGLALSSKTVRDSAAQAAAPAVDKARDMMDDATARAQALRSDVSDAASSTRSQAMGMIDDAQDAASDVGAALRSRAAQAADTVTDAVKSGVDATRDTIERARATAMDTATAARDAAATVPAKAGRAVGENAALIGGLGVAIGAIIAAALPATRAEGRVMGQASDSVKRAAGEAAQSGVNAVKETTLSAADAAAQSVADADLGRHASRMTQTVADKIKEAADDAMAAAVNPSQNRNI